MTNTNTRNINVLLPADMHATLRSLPGGLSISDHVRLALVDYLDNKVLPDVAFVNPSKNRPNSNDNPARQGKARPGAARPGLARPGGARQGKAR